MTIIYITCFFGWYRRGFRAFRSFCYCFYGCGLYAADMMDFLTPRLSLGPDLYCNLSQEHRVAKSQLLHLFFSRIKFWWFIRKLKIRKFLKNTSQLCLHNSPKGRLFKMFFYYVKFLILTHQRICCVWTTEDGGMDPGFTYICSLSVNDHFACCFVFVILFLGAVTTWTN